MRPYSQWLVLTSHYHRARRAGPPSDYATSGQVVKQRHVSSAVRDSNTRRLIAPPHDTSYRDTSTGTSGAYRITKGGARGVNHAMRHGPGHGRSHQLTLCSVIITGEHGWV